MKTHKFATKLILFFILVSIIPLNIVNFIWTANSVRSLKAQAKETTQQILSQSKMSLDSAMDSINAISLSIIFDLNINEILAAKPAGIQERVNSQQLLTDVLRRNKNISSHISSITIISDHYKVSSTSEHVDYAKLQSTEWFDSFYRSEEQKACSGVYYNDYISRYNIPVFSLMRRINNPETGKCIGILLIEVKYAMLKHIFDPIHANGDGQILVFNQSGEMMYHPDFNQVLSGPGSGRAVYQTLYQETSRFTEEFEDDDQAVNCIVTDSFPWVIADITPQSLLAAQSKHLGKSIRSIFFVVSGLLLILILILSYQLTQPIQILVSSMKKVEEGDLSISVPVRTQDEIGLLGESFNRMINRINRLIQEVYKSEANKRDAELKALQAQINPHFLYNTLNSIRWMANMHGAESISKAIISLVRILEFSSNTSAEYVTVQQETQHVKYYESLLKLRYADKFTVDYRISEDALPCYMPKFILQPIVENAVFHGIEPKETPGTIVVSIHRAENTITFSISDDGVGMKQENVEHRKFTGIGIGNVNERLIRHCGETCGLQIESAPGKGTVVTFSIPALSSPPATGGVE